MRPIRAWWWRPQHKPYALNLGDEINRRILAYGAQREVQHCALEEAELIGIGSILELAARALRSSERSEPLHVWGSGLIAPTPWQREGRLILHALRGPLSRCVLAPEQPLALGDPGLLAPLIWQRPKGSRQGLGIVLHHSQMANPALRAGLAEIPNSLLIDFTADAIDASLRQLAGCERILSSGLHGLILADAYGIPNAWASFGALRGGNGWKFFDYGLSVGRALAEPVLSWHPGQGSQALQQRLACTKFSQAEPVEITALQATLLAAFPDLS